LAVIVSNQTAAVQLTLTLRQFQTDKNLPGVGRGELALTAGNWADIAIGSVADIAPAFQAA